MRGQLTVRISDGSRDQHVTRFVKGLRFTKTAPGGHHSASVSIDAPEGLFGDLGPADRLFIYDGRNARTIWDGYVENPGRVTVAGGARYDLSAMGGVVLASDNARAVVFRSTDLSTAHWTRIGDVESAQAAVDGGAIKLQFQPGSPVGVGSHAGMLSTMLAATNQPLRGVFATVQSGQAGGAASYINFYNPDGTFHAQTPVNPIAVTPADVNGLAYAGDFTFGGVSTFALVMANTAGDTNVTADTVWSRFSDVVVAPGLKTKEGAIPGGALVIGRHIRANEVVAHILGDMLPQVDGAAAVVEQASFPIDTLAYMGGAKPFEILDDLSLFEPNFLWEILESDHAGKHRFAYRAWPTTARYEISGREFTESGGESDLCNRVVVSWNDETGAEQAATVLTDVPALGSRVRDADPISLPDGMGSLANAVQIGGEVLAALNTPSRSGTAVVRQPILDRLSGLMVMPWEIEPGYLVRVRDMGVDLRLTEMTYDDADCTASLTLGTPTLTLAQRLARLNTRRVGGRP